MKKGQERTRLVDNATPTEPYRQPPLTTITKLSHATTESELGVYGSPCCVCCTYVCVSVAQKPVYDYKVSKRDLKGRSRGGVYRKCVRVCGRYFVGSERGDKLCSVLMCCITYHFSALLLFVSEGAEGATVCNERKGGSWLGPPFLEECTQYNGSKSLTSPLIVRQDLSIFVHLSPDDTPISYIDIQLDRLPHPISNMSSQHRSSDETSIKTNSSPYIVLKTDTPVSHIKTPGCELMIGKKMDTGRKRSFLEHDR